MDLLQLDWLIGILPGVAIGIFSSRIFLKPKTSKGIASSADNKLKLENELLNDKVKQLEAKILTLEKALEMTTK